MSRVLRIIARARGISGNKRDVLLAIGMFQGVDGLASPSIAGIADHTEGLCERTVRRLVRQLEQEDLVQVVRQSRGRVRNQYRINVDKLRAMCPVSAVNPAKLSGLEAVPPTTESAPTRTVSAGDVRRSEVPQVTPPVRARASEGLEAAEATGQAHQVLANLPSPWADLSRGQRQRLAPLVDEALRAGWQPGALVARVTAGNADGVRSAFAVLRHRLQDLPEPPRRPEPKPAGPSLAEMFNQRDAAATRPRAELLAETRAQLQRARERVGQAA